MSIARTTQDQLDSLYCEAATCIAAQCIQVDDPTIGGIQRYCADVKRKAQSLQDELRLMQQ